MRFFYHFFRLIFVDLINSYRFFRMTSSFGAGSTIRGIRNINIGEGFSHGRFCEFYSQSENSVLSIGSNVALNSFVHINADFGSIVIGNNVLIGPGVVIRSSNHQFSNPTIPVREQGHEPGKVIIEDGVWIGANAIILPNVIIGKNSIIGAGSVVTKSIDSNIIAAGSPARYIKNRASKLPMF